MTSTRVSIPGLLATIAIVATVVLGMVVMGSPATVRARRLDRVRSGDLMQLNAAIGQYWDRHMQLPASLDSLMPDPPLDSLPRDPATKTPYQYTVTATDAFRLCATFVAAGEDGDHSAYVDPYSHPRLRHHGIGLTCFTLTPHELNPKIPNGTP